MKSSTATRAATSVSRPLAAEDLKCGDFVGILSETVEWPSFFWSCDGHLLPPDHPVRLTCKSSAGGTPLKVKAISLPFVFVKQPGGQHQTLDVRRHKLVRLSPKYARQAWKALSKQSANPLA
jgi:hypothetical protein